MTKPYTLIEKYNQYSIFKFDFPSSNYHGKFFIGLPNWEFLACSCIPQPSLLSIHAVPVVENSIGDPIYFDSVTKLCVKPLD